MHYWIVRDSQTGEEISRFGTFGMANRVAERLNQKYGAVRYTPILRSESLKHVASSAPAALKVDKY